MTDRIDISHAIERLEAFEDRTGVKIEGLYAYLDDDGDVTVNGEIHARNGGNLRESIDLVVVGYDEAGRVLDSQTYWIDADRFLSFEPFKIILFTKDPSVSRVRVFPKVS